MSELDGLLEQCASNKKLILKSYNKKLPLITYLLKNKPTLSDEQVNKLMTILLYGKTRMVWHYYDDGMIDYVLNLKLSDEHIVNLIKNASFSSLSDSIDDKNTDPIHPLKLSKQVMIRLMIETQFICWSLTRTFLDKEEFDLLINTTIEVYTNRTARYKYPSYIVNIISTNMKHVDKTLMERIIATEGLADLLIADEDIKLDADVAERIIIRVLGNDQHYQNRRLYPLIPYLKRYRLTEQILETCANFANISSDMVDILYDELVAYKGIIPDKFVDTLAENSVLKLLGTVGDKLKTRHLTTVCERLHSTDKYLLDIDVIKFFKYAYFIKKIEPELKQFVIFLCHKNNLNDEIMNYLRTKFDINVDILNLIIRLYFETGSNKTSSRVRDYRHFRYHNVNIKHNKLYDLFELVYILLSNYKIKPNAETFEAVMTCDSMNADLMTTFIDMLVDHGLQIDRIRANRLKNYDVNYKRTVDLLSN